MAPHREGCVCKHGWYWYWGFTTIGIGVPNYWGGPSPITTIGGGPPKKAFSLFSSISKKMLFPRRSASRRNGMETKGKPAQPIIGIGIGIGIGIRGALPNTGLAENKLTISKSIRVVSADRRLV